MYSTLVLQPSKITYCVYFIVLSRQQNPKGYYLVYGNVYMLLSMFTDRLQTENKLLRAEADSLSQQNRQQQQGLSQVEELATMLQESHRLLYGHNLFFYCSLFYCFLRVNEKLKLSHKIRNPVVLV